MKNLSGILFIFFILFLTLQISSGKEINKEKEYKDKSDRYSFLLPEKWKYYEDNNEVTFEYDDGKIYASFYIEGYPIEKNEKLTLKELASQVQTGEYKEEGMEVYQKILSTTETTVDGVPSLLVHQKSELKGNIEGKTFTDISIIDEYFFIKNNHTYIISFNTGEASYNKLKSDFDNIVKSFKVGKKPFKGKGDK